jgi:lipoate-protein ligase A
MHKTELEFLIFYINKKSVIVGKHQNAFSEANIEYLKTNNIPLVRRISGGGTVYHDSGNLNISIIENKSKVNFNNFLKPIITFLQKLNLNAVQNFKNDIEINNKKVSGSAAHIYKNRCLHHATLLIESDLDTLRKSLNVNRNKFISKSIPSKPSIVTNICDELNNKINAKELINLLKEHLMSYYKITEFYRLDSETIDNIRHFATNRFKSWEWNYGASPAFVYIDSFDKHRIECNVKNGFVEECLIYINNELKERIHPQNIKFNLPIEDLINEIIQQRSIILKF